MGRQSEPSSETEIIHCWSTPRSLSTCLMYSFAQRDDIDALDEPFYANFLRLYGSRVPPRDYSTELLSKTEPDVNKFVNEVIFGPGDKKYRYCKNMANQKAPNMPKELMTKGKHFLLIRNPIYILSSFRNVLPPSFLELGLADLVAIYCELCELGNQPPIIDAQDLQQQPEATLRQLCNDLKIPFQDSMLKWEAGPKPMDGIWGKWWYKSVHKHTCFKPNVTSLSAFPKELYDLVEDGLPFYNFLKRKSRMMTSSRSSFIGACLSTHPPTLAVSSNERIFVWVGDELLPYEDAKISVLNSVVQDGDAVWEGLSVYNGKIFMLDEHLQRLFDSANALAFNKIPTSEKIKEAIFTTLIINGMHDNANIKLTLTRGTKVASGQSQKINLCGCTLIVLVEWKPPTSDNSNGITLFTIMDSKMHQNNLLNTVLAKVRGNIVHDVIMLDEDDFVSKTNTSNIFLVKKGCVSTLDVGHCLPSLTREVVIDLLLKENIMLEERMISRSECQIVDEVWTIGMMGEIMHVSMIDGHIIGNGQAGSVTKMIQGSYAKLISEIGELIPV